MQTKIIGVSGGKCSGKSTLCKKICEELKGVEISFLSLDSFKKLESGPFVDFQDNSLNHHHPDLINFKLLHTTLLDLVSGKDVIINDFDYKTRSLVGKKTVKSTKVILIEGDLILYKKDIRDLLSLKIFIDLDSDQRLQRLVVHEVEENRRQLEDVLEEYHRFIKPCFDRHISNTKIMADIILPRGSENATGSSMLCTHIRDFMNGKVRAFFLNDNMIKSDIYC